MSSEPLIIYDPKVCEFYKSNPNVNPEVMNIILVDLLEQLVENMDDTMSNTMLSQIMRGIRSMSSEITDIKQNVNNIQDDVIGQFVLKLQETRTGGFQDIKEFIISHSQNNNHSIQQYVLEQCDKIIQTSYQQIENIIPRTNQTFYSDIQERIYHFKTDINNTITQSLSDNNIEKMISQYDIKTMQFITSIQQNLSSVENNIVSNINDIKNDSQKDKLMSDLSDFLSKYTNSSYKGQFGENKLESVLSQLYPSAEVMNTTGKTACCDFHLKRPNKPVIMIETKNYDKNVTLGEVQKFIRDIEKQKQHGIFLSHHSGITSKQNFQIDFVGSQIAIYVHSVDYSPQIIKTCVDIVDSLHTKTQVLFENDNENTNIIPKEILDAINDDFRNLVTNKQKLLDTCKQFNKTITSQLDNLNLPSLDSYLKPLYSNVTTISDEPFKCDICNVYETTNNRSLSRHKISCRKKYEKTQTNDSDLRPETPEKECNQHIQKSVVDMMKQNNNEIPVIQELGIHDNVDNITIS